MDAWVFPGQGSQFRGMGDALTAPAARDVFRRASDVLGWDVLHAAALDDTASVQPAIFTTSVAAARALQAEGLRPSAVAGHSVGELAALAVAEALSFEDGLRLVAARGAAMAAAGRERPGRMAALLGLDEATARLACEAAAGDVVVASVNAPGQIVISGEASAVGAAMDAARGLGAKRAVLLEVSVAAHAPLMAPAAERLGSAVREVRLRAPAIPFVSSVTGRRADDPIEIAGLIVRALTEPVRWTDAVRALLDLGAGRTIEVGPGRVLSGLIRKIAPVVAVEAVGDDADLARVGRSVARVRS